MKNDHCKEYGCCIKQNKCPSGNNCQCKCHQCDKVCGPASDTYLKIGGSLAGIADKYNKKLHQGCTNERHRHNHKIDWNAIGLSSAQPRAFGIACDHGHSLGTVWVVQTSLTIGNTNGRTQSPAVVPTVHISKDARTSISLGCSPSSLKAGNLTLTLNGGDMKLLDSEGREVSKRSWSLTEGVPSNLYVKATKTGKASATCKHDLSGAEAKIDILVTGIDMIVDNLGETEEVDPGVLIAHEYMKPLEIKVEPKSAGGSVTLTLAPGLALFQGNTDLTNPPGGSTVHSWTWNNVDKIPTDLHVKGVAVSTKMKDRSAVATWSNASLPDTVFHTVVKVGIEAPKYVRKGEEAMISLSYAPTDLDRTKLTFSGGTKLFDFFKPGTDPREASPTSWNPGDASTPIGILAKAKETGQDKLVVEHAPTGAKAEVEIAVFHLDAVMDDLPEEEENEEDNEIEPGAFIGYEKRKKLNVTAEPKKLGGKIKLTLGDGLSLHYAESGGGKAVETREWNIDDKNLDKLYIQGDSPTKSMAEKTCCTVEWTGLVDLPEDTKVDDTVNVNVVQVGITAPRYLQAGNEGTITLSYQPTDLDREKLTLSGSLDLYEFLDEEDNNENEEDNDEESNPNDSSGGGERVFNLTGREGGSIALRVRAKELSGEGNNETGSQDKLKNTHSPTGAEAEIDVDTYDYEVNIEKDSDAAERLSNVEQKYGYFKIERKILGNPPVDEETGESIAESIDVGFMVIEAKDNKRDSTYLANSELSDYRLYVTDEKKENAAELSLTSVTTENFYLHQGSLTIPLGKELVYVEVRPRFDWEDEGEEGWEGENVTMTLTEVTKPSKLGSKKTDILKIRDGAIIRLRTDSNNDGSISQADDDPLVKNHSDHPGRLFRVNLDDDDGNGRQDRYDRHADFDIPSNPQALAGSGPYIYVRGEDDLAEVQIEVEVQCFDPIDKTVEPIEVDVYFLTPNDFVVWTKENKGSRVHRGQDDDGDGRVDLARRLATLTQSNKKFERSLYVEAVATPGGGSAFELFAAPLQGPKGTDKAKMTPFNVDLDIDSDNNNGLLGAPSRSLQEEFFEDHEYASGKIIIPNHGDMDGDKRLDCWDGYGMIGHYDQMNPNSSLDFIPIVLDVPSGMSADSVTLEFSYQQFMPTWRNHPECEQKPDGTTPGVGDGRIRIWTRNGSEVRHTNNFVESDLKYTLQELNASGSTLTLYVEGLTENMQVTPDLAREHGKPETKIVVKYGLPGVSTNNLEDSVLYTVSGPGSFYYELMMHPELHAAYASQAIYDRKSKKEYCLKLQSTEELISMGIPSELRMLLSHVDDWGFQAGLYREYITGRYYLAYAGTDPTTLVDLITNFTQAFGFEGTVQYDLAIEIGKALPEVQPLIKERCYITGHSLGGGLASATASLSGFNAFTFNAAGLHQGVVTAPPNVNSFIISYRVDWDFLSWGQWIPGWHHYLFGTPIPAAVGTPIILDSQYDAQMMVTGIAIVATMVFELAPVSAILALNVVRIGFKCHLMDQCIYGLEKRIFTDKAPTPPLGN